MKQLKVSFPGSDNPDLKVGVLCGVFEDDATQYHAVQRFAEWARTAPAGIENRTLLAGTGPICLHLVPIEPPGFEEREAAAEKATEISRKELEALGFEPEVTRPDIGVDGWIVATGLDDPRLDPFACFQVGSHTIITGKEDQ